jgi:glycosyltransferase involved in cell wall biosynthesis
MEWMEVGKDEGNRRKRWAWYESQRQYINMQLTAADFVICNNERQRDFWLGVMQSLGLVTGGVYDRDHTLRRLIDVCSHGIRPDPLPEPGPEGGAVRRRLPGIELGDTVLLWNAGIVSWYDPVTAIRAVHAISRERPDVKLVFIGTKYPDPGFIEEVPIFAETMRAAAELDVTDKQVFFVRGWLPYEEVKGYLADSYLGLCTYRNNAETHYAHRTRFSDLIWAELPIVCTRGDVLSQMVEERGLGLTVPEGDVDAVVTTLRRLLEDRDFYACCVRNLRALKSELSWEQTLAPLVEFCRQPVQGAASKRERLIPLLRRTAGYLTWRLISGRMR